MLDWNNKYNMKSWIPCYSLISVGIFKSFSWPPSEAARLKRDVQNKGKKVKPLQIPPPTSSFAGSAPLICVASDSWGDTGTKQWHISYWACPGQSRGLNGLQGWQEKVIEAFAGDLGEEERRMEWCPLWKKFFWTENLLVVELLFSSKGQKSQLVHGVKERAQLQQGQGQPHHGDKRQELQKMKGFYSHLLLHFKWRVKTKQAKIPKEDFRCLHCEHFCQEGSSLKDDLCYWHQHNITVLSLLLLKNTLYALQDVWKHSSSRHQWGGADRNIKAY